MNYYHPLNHWPYHIQHHYPETETPEQLRYRADELERKQRADQSEEREMIDKLKKRGFVINKSPHPIAQKIDVSLRGPRSD